MTRPPAPDPGRQPERTQLAWRRTALAMTVVTGLIMRQALIAGPVGALPAAATGLGWAGLMLILRPWQTAPPPSHRPTGPGRLLPLAALATAGYAVLGVLLVLGTLG